MAEAFVDYEKRQFVTRDGVALDMQPVSKMIIERMYSDQSKKPKPPVVEVVLGGTYTSKQTNPDDPDYQKALANWQSEKNMRVLKYGLVHGIKNSPPAPFIEEYAEYFPDATEPDMKYLWVVSMLGPDGEDIPLITEAITGQTMPTEKGIEDSVDSFPSNGQERTVDIVPVVEATD